MKLSRLPTIRADMVEREQLQSRDVAQRAAAAEALSQMGPDASPAAVELVRACSDDESVRDWAVAALEELGPPPHELTKPLSELVSDRDALVAYWAITLLGRAGSVAQPFGDKLIAAFQQNSDVRVRERAVWALGKVGAESDEAIQVLNAAASSTSPRLSRLAQAALQDVHN